MNQLMKSREITVLAITANKKYWKTVTPFVANANFFSRSKVTLYWKRMI